MFFIIIGVVVGVFIEQTYPLPNLREMMKCAKGYGESTPTKTPTKPDINDDINDINTDFETDETDGTTHTD